MPMSSSDIAIRVSNLSKCYHIYDNPRDRLKQFILPRIQGVTRQPQKQYFKEFWALKDINFEIKKGESVGIIGRNGSGKSTLLQIITGTLSPTSGTVTTNGRIAALLELGSGFNPDFTGRENVYLNGVLLGLSRAQINERFDTIANFADIGQFIEQPIKTYSSGMLVRLAFSVAINVDPDILIIDEALSVGDELFQRKCFSRIEKIRSNGATVIIVSHSSTAIIELCNKAILINQGIKIAFGVSKQVIGKYQKLLNSTVEMHDDVIKEIIGSKETTLIVKNTNKDFAKKDLYTSKHERYDPNFKSSCIIEYATNGAYISLVSVSSIEGLKVNNLINGKIYQFIYHVKFLEIARNVRFGMMIKTVTGIELGGGISASSFGKGVESILADTNYKVAFSFRCVLNPGVYFLNAGVLGVVNDSEEYLHRLLDCLCIKVLPSDSDDFSNGIVDFEVVPNINIYE